MNWLSQMRARSEEEISKLSERVQHLQKLYESQELIISKNKKYFHKRSHMTVYERGVHST